MMKFLRLFLERQARRRLRSYVSLGRGSRATHKKIVVQEGCSIAIGDDSLIDAGISFDKPDARVTIGNRTFIGASSLVCAQSIVIGDDVMIAWGSTLVDHNSHALSWSERRDDVVNWGRGVKDWSFVKTAPVVVRDKAWIGFNCIILKGVTIGEGAIVGAGSVVTKDVPPYTVVAGNPARTVRELRLDER